MLRYELANEGCATPAGEQAFARYNELLRKQPDQLTQAISFLALNQELPETHVVAANTVTTVLDTTNDGTQIGIGPDTETGWAHVFDDQDHRQAQSVHNKQAQTVQNIAKQLEQARRDIETLDEGLDTAGYQAARELIENLEITYEEAQAELIIKRRLRGMQTLKVIALLGGASEKVTNLPLAA